MLKRDLSPCRINLPWQALRHHHQQMKNVHLLRLFTDDDHRGEHFSLDVNGLYLDYSKNLVTEKTIGLLMDLARAKGLPARIDERFAAMDQGLDAAYRQARQQDTIMATMSHLAGRIWHGEWTGYSGMRIRTVVNLNVDEPDPGPPLVHQALKSLIHGDLTTIFIGRSNYQDFPSILTDLNPAETLFVVVSTSFTCRETIACAHTARRWILKAMRDECAVARHFIAVSDNENEARMFGIETGNIFGRRRGTAQQHGAGMLDFSILLCLGPALFQRLLTGIRSMDRHFGSAPLQRNLPVVMGLIRVWYCNFYGCRQFSILPTPGRLSDLPGYIGQLITMQSRTMDVKPGAEAGEIDPNRQMLQQEMICQQIMVDATLHPCDFIGLCRDETFSEERNKLHMAKMFALTKSLAFGSHWQELRGDSYPQVMEQCLPIEGNHPSNTLLAESLTPEILGEILALYGHSIYTQQVVGQWDMADLKGLQSGKLEAGIIVKELERDSGAGGHDSSTAGLIRHYRSVSGTDRKLYLS